MPLLQRLRALSARRAALLGLACLCALALLAQAGALLYLRLNEDELVFHTAQSRLQRDGELPAEAESFTIRAQDGSALAAFLLRAPVAQDSGYWILHLHGNAASAFSPEQIRHCRQLQQLGFSVLCFDYRGFGRSGGRASEAHLDQDAEAALQALIDRGIAPAHIIVWGHSLGSGPAVLLARAYPVAALVLFGAFTSVPDVAQQIYPYLPVRWIAGIHFDSIDRIGQVHVPVLIVHATTDTLIPVEHARRLYAAANAPKRLLLLQGSFHDGFGGHLDALYDQGDRLLPALSALLGVPLSAH
ncbi:MAG: alpha/beta hydrolase [Steroidobacteraceae bacterium]